MPAPTVTTATVPGTSVVAGAPPVTMTLVGTNFAAGMVATSSRAGVRFGAVTVADAANATVKVSADGSTQRAGKIPITLTNTDAGTVTNTTAGPAVSWPGVNAGALDQYAANATPGATPGTAGEAIRSKAETTHYVSNPAWDPANEIGVESQQGSSADFPGIASPPGGTQNPGAGSDDRNDETVNPDHSPQLPGKPVITSATAGAAGVATVNWTAPAAEVHGYRVTSYVVTATSSDGGTTRTATVAGTVLTANVTGMTSTKNYTFTVRAVNAAGQGDLSTASSSVLIA